jgi:hypothetical protein
MRMEGREKVSGIGYQVSGIRYQVSGIRYQVSGGYEWQVMEITRFRTETKKVKLVKNLIPDTRYLIPHSHRALLVIVRKHNRCFLKFKTAVMSQDII